MFKHYVNENHRTVTDTFYNYQMVKIWSFHLNIQNIYLKIHEVFSNFLPPPKDTSQFLATFNCPYVEISM